jgi:DNA-binding transcriptional MerR regulator
VIEADSGRHWSIGALAQACGVTVRTLHHYDRIGLLTPNERTASGHRRYTSRDLRRLYRIRTLQALGLSLEDIADTLAGQHDDLAGLRDVLATQLHGLGDQITRLDAIRNTIDGLLQQIDAGRMPDPHQFMTTLEMMSVYETHFTQEQRDQLAQRRTELGPTAVDATRDEWIGLVAQLLPHVAANTPSTIPR